MKRPRRKRRGAFNLPAIRRREIERHARDVGAADTEDYWRWLVAWVWHNPTSTDQVFALEDISEKMGRKLGPSEIDEILDQAKAIRRRCSADALAKFLGVTYARRQRLRITTIGAIDVGERARKELRRRRNRRAHEQRRRANGVRPRAEYRATSRTACKPWEAAGLSRRTWYRKTSAAMVVVVVAAKAAAAAAPAKDGAVPLSTSPSAAIPTLTECAENGTSPSAALFLSPADTPVPPERKQGDFREGDCPKGTAQTASRTSLVLENGVLLTRRWIAARERLCGCRHNGRLYPQVCQKEAAEWHQAITEKQPDAADAVPDQAEKAPSAADVISAPPAMTYDEEVAEIRRRKLPPGNQTRALNEAKNREMTRQFDAQVRKQQGLH
jgi:hypothetical protein